MTSLRTSLLLAVSLSSTFFIASCGGGSMTPAPNPTMAQLIVQPAGSGGGTVSSTPAGINCQPTCGASFKVGTQVVLSATPTGNSTFVGWGGACSGTGTCAITLSANTMATATFSSLSVLSVTTTGLGTVTSSPAGINCGLYPPDDQTCSAGFKPGTQVVLTATPGADWTLTGWSGGGCSGNHSTCTITVSQNTQISATFSPIPLPMLSVALSGTGQGTITSNPSGINCGKNCTAGFKSGTEVVLTETPATNSTFAGWSGGGCSGNATTCTVTLTANTQINASFNTGIQPVLTVTLSGTGQGTVTSSPSGINCGTICMAPFALGTQVLLTETPGTNSIFTGWSGGVCSGNAPTCTVTMSSSKQVTATFGIQGTISVLNHIVFLAQENRSFDHYFGQMRQYWAQNGYPDQSFDGLPQFNPLSGQPPLYGPPPSIPGCDPSQPPPETCKFDPQNLVTSFALITQCVENPSPSWNEGHNDWDFYDPTGMKPATLNGFVWTAGYDARADGFFDVDGLRAMGYYSGSDLNYYYFMASNFATSDRWFNAAMTRTHPNREYLVAGTSQGYAYPVGTDGNDKALLTATTIFQELQSAGISWKIYVDPTGTSCTGPPYDPACLLGYTYIQFFQWGQTIPTTYPNNIGTIGPPGTCGSSPCDYENDLANGTLPQVVQIEPATDAGFDEHPSVSDSEPNDIQRGANYVSSIINDLMNSSSWPSSAFILTFDEGGGFYDHVSPQPAVSPDGIKPVDLLPGDICTQSTGPTCDFVYTGYRIPLVVISPYSNKNYVSHTVADLTAILKLIETRFNLPSLTKRDAAQMDMTEFFNFNNPVWLTPPTPPAQNTNGACYLNKLP